MSEDPGRLLDVAKSAARCGADELMRWRSRFHVREKSPHDLVTDADMASEDAVRTAIAQTFPDHGFLGEESTTFDQLKKPFCWIVDPLDGTTNYAHGLPCYAVSVAVAHQGEIVAGVVLDPERDECFAASRGGGATLNGKPIETSEVAEVDRSLLAISLPPRIRDDAPDFRSFLKTVPLCQAVRRTGSAALNLAYVACGRLDGHWAHEINVWDGAAGVILVREAGGVVTDCDGGPYDLSRADYLAAATPQLHQALLELIRP